MVIGIIVNVGLSFLMHVLDVPLFLDTIGTIAVSAMTGSLWGLSTAVGTHLISTAFNPESVYFMGISVIISLLSVSMLHYSKAQRKRFIPLFIALLAVLGGVIGTGIQWILTGGPTFQGVADVAGAVAEPGSTKYGILCLLISFGLDFVDKAICVGVAFVAVRVVPTHIRYWLWNSNWKQTPLSNSAIENLNKVSGNGNSVGGRIFALIMTTGIILITVQCFITLLLYEETVHDEYTATVTQAAEFVAESIDGDMVDNYLASGKAISKCNMKNYKTAYEAIERACRWMNGIEYMYVYQIREDGAYVVMDVDPETANTMIGSKIEFDSAFLPYVDDLSNGRNIPVIESDDQFGHLLTAYVPIRDSLGSCVAYAGADVSYSVIEEYTKKYLTRTILIIVGFFIFVTGTGLWIARYFMVRPLKSIALALDDFAVEDSDQKTLDGKVKEFRDMRIRTGDEVEFMYESLCRMLTAVAEQMRDLRHYTEATAQMQNGLIITMADMVESRDSDTGAHIQKTAAYVKIILEGLKRKGYYAEKLTPKYMSDAVISAPLHDVGKINVPDAVLNKPGKLTDEEYEIIKTHTTAGREIIERAIDTVHGENYLKEARNMAAYHHERWDGKGYPEGLHGEVIPLSARVMAVADVFDALTAKRVYKPAFPLEKALSILEEGAGTQFDPKCVEVFMDSLTEVKIVLKKYSEM